MKIVSIEGSIGSGKSELIEALEESDFEGEMDLRPEPIYTWQNFANTNILALLGTDPTRWSFLFQMYVYFTMCNSYFQPARVGRRVKVRERSIGASRHVFVEAQKQAGHLTEAEYQLLVDFYDMWVRKFPSLYSDVKIFIKCDPEVCLERIKQRGREEESYVTLEYLQSLDKAYKDWLAFLGNASSAVYEVDGNRPREEIVSEVLAIIRNEMF